MLDRMTAPSPFLERESGPASSMPLPGLNVIGHSAASPLLQQTAKLCGLDCIALAPAAILSGTALSGAIVWAMVDAADADWLGKLIERQTDEQFPLIVQTDLAGLDAVIHAVDHLPGCSITVSPDEAAMVAALASHLRMSQASVHASIDAVRDRQIETLQEEVQRISRMLARLAMEPERHREPPSPFIDDHVSAKARGYHAGPGSNYDGPTVSSRDVRQVIRQRRLRDELFDSELFADPAWDMLLDLYAARLDRSRVSVSSLCIAAAVPATTALRWIKTLTETGLFERKADQHDARRIFVQLSDEATQAMHRYFARLSDPRLAV